MNAGSWPIELPRSVRWVLQRRTWHATPYNLIVAPMVDPADPSIHVWGTPSFCGVHFTSRHGVPLTVVDSRPATGTICKTCDRLADVHLEGASEE